MLSFRYTVSLLSAFFARFKWVLLASVFSGLLFFLIFNIFSKQIFQSKTEKIGIVGRFKLDNLPENVLKDVSLGLTSISETGEVKPGIASSWETTDSGKTWIFHLSDKYEWQDGKKILSSDIKINFSDVEIQRPDPKTIVFKLQTPFAPFPGVISKPLFKKGFLGLGDWKVSKITVSGGNVEKLIISKTKVGKKIYKFYPTEERAKLAIKLGEVDSLFDIFSSQPFDSWKTLKVSNNIDYGRFVTLFFNSSKDKITSDKSLRQALNYAINKKFLGESRAISPISPNSWAYNPQVKPYDYDPDRAKELIKTLSKDIQNKLSINIATTPVLLEKAESIAKDWRNIGFKVNVQVTSQVPENFDTFLAILDSPNDPDQYSLWHSSQESSNISNYKNQRIDKLLEDGRTVVNHDERKKIYLDFQRFLVEDSPAAFLYYPTSYTISRK